MNKLNLLNGILLLSSVAYADAVVPAHVVAPAAPSAPTKLAVVEAPAPKPTPNAKTIKNLIELLKKNDVDAGEVQKAVQAGGEKAALVYINSKVADKDKGAVLMAGFSLRTWISASFKKSLAEYEKLELGDLIKRTDVMVDADDKSDGELARLMATYVVLSRTLQARDAQGLKDRNTDLLVKGKADIGALISKRYEVDTDYFLLTVIK